MLVMGLRVREHHMKGVALTLRSPLEPAGSAGLRLFVFWQARVCLDKAKDRWASGQIPKELLLGKVPRSTAGSDGAELFFNV